MRYQPDSWRAALRDGSLIELRGMIRPAEDIALYRAEMAAWPGSGAVPDWRQAQADWVKVNDDFRRDILDRLDDEGPLTLAGAAGHQPGRRGGPAAGTTTATSA